MYLLTNLNNLKEVALATSLFFNKKIRTVKLSGFFLIDK